MPTPARPTPLLALLAGTACALTPWNGLAQSGGGLTFEPEAFERMRPGAAAAGPRGMRRLDTAVEPAAFRSLGLPKPLAPSAAVELKPIAAAEPSAGATNEAELTTPSSNVEPPPEAQELDAESRKTLPLEPQASADESFDAADELPLTEPSARVAEPVGGRLLAPKPSAAEDAPQRTALPANPLESLMEWRPSSQTMTASGAGLAIVVGLLLSFVWLIRSLAPKSSRPLPREVVEVLGRASLGGKQTTQLVRVGHKLVLIAITPDGAETLTEITDPDEVARLVAACETSSGRGSTADFDSMLRQMESERTGAGFLDARDDRNRSAGGYGFADGAFDPRSLAAAYANTPGGRGDG